MKQVTKTLLMLVLVAASTSTIGSASARPPGGGGSTPPPQPPIGTLHEVWTCFYPGLIVQFETPCPFDYHGKVLINSIYGPPMI